MDIRQAEKEFQPIIITLESREEVQDLVEGLRESTGNVAYEIYRFLLSKKA